MRLPAAERRRADAQAQDGGVTSPEGPTQSEEAASPTGPSARSVRTAVVIVVGVLVLLLAPLKGCAHRSQPFDPAQNKPVLPGAAANSPGEGITAPSAAYTAQGSEGPGCLAGWAEARPGTPVHDEALRATGAAAARRVRVFVGDGRTWTLVEAPRGRFLLADGSLVARAPAGTRGWQGAGWRAPAGGDAVAAGVLPVYLTGCLP